MVAKLILQSGDINRVTFGYCKSHRTLGFLSQGGGYTDATGISHKQGRQPVPYHWPMPAQCCDIQSVPSDYVAGMDNTDQLSRMAETISRIRETFAKYGKSRDPVDEQVTDYKTSAAKADIKETSSHIEILESGPRPIVKLNPEGFNSYARCLGCHHIATECICFDRID
jgi:hypothetical protein